MIIFKSGYTGNLLNLSSCPFCGGDNIDFLHVGTFESKRRKIIIKCIDCRITRTDSVAQWGFDKLEQIAMKNWNTRAKR